jgi:hypothetical protein
MEKRYLALVVAFVVIVAGIAGYLVATNMPGAPVAANNSSPQVAQPTNNNPIVRVVRVPVEPSVTPAAPTKVPTFVSISYTTQNVTLGDKLYFSVGAAVKNGGPMAGVPVDIYINGVLRQTVTTDINGYAYGNLSPGLALGTGYSFTAYYPGDATHFNYSATTYFNVVNGTV